MSGYAPGTHLEGGPNMSGLNLLLTVVAVVLLILFVIWLFQAVA